MPCTSETNSVVRMGPNPDVKVAEEGKSMHLHLTLDHSWQIPYTTPVTTQCLGLAAVPKVAYENADGTPLTVDTDYFGKPRNATNPSPGPFEDPGEGKLTLKVW